MKKLMYLIVVLIIIAGGWWILHQSGSTNVSPTNNYTSNDTGGSTSVSQSTNIQSTSTVGSTNTGGSSTGTFKSFTITGSPYKFVPNAITVNKGDTVKITFVNSEGNHNLVIDEFNVKTNIIPAGQSQTITFVADKTGSFQYYCSVGTHRQLGMWGTLTVK